MAVVVGDVNADHALLASVGHAGLAIADIDSAVGRKRQSRDAGRGQGLGVCETARPHPPGQGRDVLGARGRR